MVAVFLLQHYYEVENLEETKIIGIYSTKEKAEVIIRKYQELPGFKLYPGGFYIDEYNLDEDNWTEGFINVG
ncbi:DUF7336 domain-containing protein [Desulfosporosinus youngiae]|uniref:DUF7336 domain-containing protein n=1 Tax=Desulfosporosinus youngiae DSM 17734 TaxID=768710 RepID=H5Y4G9_9FIRM|nr:hypothetical protein [Desulfosporosinus youngiae]EHQ89567.1 hypothetical protein DesyoDRAFT_2494 [Desulfosporosinus youngiae DSM 17734]